MAQLDPSIILGAQMPHILTPQEQQANANALRGQQQEQQLRAAQIQDVQAQQNDRALQTAARVKALAGQDAIAAAIKKHTHVDPDTGAHSVDYQAIAEDVGAAGFPTEANSWLDMQGKNADNLQKLTTAHRGYMEQQFETLGGLASTAQSRDDFVAGVGLAAAHGLIDEPTARQVVTQVDAAGGDAWKAVADHYKQLAPSYQKSHTPEAIAALAKTAAETATANATAAHTSAETAGTLPETPAQKAQRLNQEATLALNVRRETEVERENRAKDAANNPLAALTGAAAVGGASAQAGQTSAAPGASQAPANPHGADFLKMLPPNIASEVQAYAEGRRPFPAGFALKSPYFQSLIQMVGQYDPTFDALNYNARAKTRADFTSGKSSQTINALNTVIGHLDSLSTATDALNNTNVPVLNSVLNQISSKLLGRPNVTNFNTVKKAVADEVTKVWRQTGGSAADIKAASDNLDAANSPQQLHEAIAEYGHLLDSKLDALKTQYAQGMGTTDTTGLNVVTPQSQAVLDKLEAKAAGQKPQSVPAEGTTGVVNGRPAIWKTVNGKAGWYAR